MKPMIVIGADFVPTETNEDLFSNGELNVLFGESLLKDISNADYRVFNLEMSIADEDSPIKKNGPSLKASEKSIKAYQALNVDFVTLANNHIMDQGVNGLTSTIESLNAAGISFAGAGMSLLEAKKPHVCIVDGKKIGIYCCAEHEFSIASEASPGANPFDPLYSLDHISDLAQSVDFLIVLYHGGKECYRYPSPNLRSVCRRCIDKGANLVICQHSHCIGCEEKYGDGTIVYGQGNFLYDDGENEFYNTGLLVCVDHSMSVSYIPLEKHLNGVRKAEGGQALRIMDEFYTRSEEIKEAEFVETEYEKFASSMLNDYLIHISAMKRPFIYRALNVLLGRKLDAFLIERKYTDDVLLKTLNFVSCEAHKELLEKGLENKLKL